MKFNPRAFDESIKDLLTSGTKKRGILRKTCMGFAFSNFARSIQTLDSELRTFPDRSIGYINRMYNNATNMASKLYSGDIDRTIRTWCDSIGKWITECNSLAQRMNIKQPQPQPQQPRWNITQPKKGGKKTKKIRKLRIHKLNKSKRFRLNSRKSGIH